MIEVQHRFLLTKPLTVSLDREHDVINDGYFEMPGGRVMRVRVSETMNFPAYVRPSRGPGAWLTSKTGHGASRTVEHVGLASADEGRRMLEWCQYHVKKRRYSFVHEGRWHLDVYEKPIEGLMVLEGLILGNADIQRHITSLPPWSNDSIEVTDSLTGLHLARLAHELTQRSGDTPIDEAIRMATRLPRIVLTGGPCSGKSKVMEEALKPRFGHLLHCVPEVATIVIGQVGIKPWTGSLKNMLAAQRLMYRAQHAFEDASDSQARTDDKKAMLTDRGVGDIAAFLPNGMTDLERMVHTTAAHEFARYDLVIVLEHPSREVYEAHKGDNAARSETYAQAVAQSLRIREAWSAHPNFRFVADTATWEAKEKDVVDIVEAFLASR